MEQSPEWNSSLYINVIKYEKVFDSVDRQTLWKLLRHCGVPEKIMNIIRNSYEGDNCRVINDQQVTDAFQVKTGVRRGMLAVAFPVHINYRLDDENIPRIRNRTACSGLSGNS